jgi:hypothetical protein
MYRFLRKKPINTTAPSIGSPVSASTTLPINGPNSCVMVQPAFRAIKSIIAEEVTYFSNPDSFQRSSSTAE